METNLIHIDNEKCVGCNKCIRSCPVHIANKSIRNGTTSIVQIKPENCIHCGECILACAHEARYYDDPINKVMSELSGGQKFAFVVAPAIKTNFPNDYKRVIGYLKSIGATEIYDTSYGAEITTWAYLKYITENNISGTISQPCPAIVNYIEKYVPELLDKLAPIQSPMTCTAVYMKEYAKVKEDIVFISPCIAKNDEVADSNTPSYLKYNITVKSLKKYIKDNGISLVNYDEVDFDNSPDCHLGSIYPMPGGLKENVLYHVKDGWVVQSEGPNRVYKELMEYAERINEGKSLPLLLDVLNCENGCNFGTGTSKDSDKYEVSHQMLEERNSADDNMFGVFKKKYEFFRYFDETLKLKDFMRKYNDRKVYIEEITEQQVDDAMLQLGKRTQHDRNHNCTACGYQTCRDMATAIARGDNCKENCIMYEKATLFTSNEKLNELNNEIGSIIAKQESLTDEVFDKLKEFMSSVKTEIDKITNETSKILEISDKTKLVSLNAAIEAARAGEAGKTFSIVATEVETLAAQSMNTASSTTAMNEKILDFLESSTKSTIGLEEEISKLNKEINERVEQIKQHTLSNQ